MAGRLNAEGLRRIVVTASVELRYAERMSLSVDSFRLQRVGQCVAQVRQVVDHDSVSFKFCGGSFSDRLYKAPDVDRDRNDACWCSSRCVFLVSNRRCIARE